ncbi:MAG TPA: FxSxx-COOH system tetratricopeptide repeat protein [Pyrinomonadaceae bacterium]|nr:FxSxx-COOH system tetratricopeptide repeat protein [Pyrinomonadaceae bacterium]
MTRGTKKDFLISFNRADRAWAAWIAWQLEEAGLTTVFQDWDFRPGGNFVLDMHAAAARAERTVAVLSPDFLASEFTAPEWAAAFSQDPTGEKGTLLPVRVRECDPQGLLGQIVYVDLVGLNEAAARSALLAGVRRGRAKPDEGPEFPSDAPRSVERRPHFPGALPPVWNVPVNRNPNFTGREDLLAALSHALSSGRPAALTQAIHGLGGVGKTQLAAEYAYRNSHLYELVWWVRSEKPSALASDYAALAAPLRLPEAYEADQPLIVRAVRAHLGQNSNWLLIFDNARTQAELRDYLPQGTTGHVIITSRDRNWRNVASPLSVQIMPRAEAVEFLLKRTSQTDAHAADQLAEALGDLPLALEQAGAYIDQTGQTLSAYLELFRAHHSRLLARGSTSTDYPDTVATTWDISFAEVRKLSPHAEPLINLLAFFAPDNIPLDIIKEGAELLPEPLAPAVTDPITFDETLAALRRYSLLERDGETISLHRLVQVVVRNRMNEENKKAWATGALRLVKIAFPLDSDDVTTWSDCSRLLAHALSTAEHAAGLEVESNVVCGVFNQVGAYLMGRGQYGQARAYLEQTLGLGEVTFGKNDPKIGSYLNNLGLVLTYTKDLKAARLHYERAIKILEAAPGADALELAVVVNNLGMVLHSLKEFVGARVNFERALVLCEASHEGTAKGRAYVTARALNNLGMVLAAQGAMADALTTMERALIFNEATYGKEHPNAAVCAANIGLLLRDRGDVVGARAHFERALHTFQSYLGEEHPHTLIARERLDSLGEEG